MSEKSGTPIEFFNSVETNKILKIALKGNPKEVARLQGAVNSQFELVISAVQSNSDFAEFFYSIVGGNKDPYARHFTEQEIKKIRKNIFDLIQAEITNKEGGEEEEEEWINEGHGSKELARLAVAIQGFYVNGTYIPNIQLLSTLASDFFKHLSGKASDGEEDGDCLVEDAIILQGNIAVLKTLKSIISAYILFLDRVPKKNLNDILKNEKTSGTWGHMGTIVAAFKKFSTESGTMEEINEMSFDFTSDLQSTLDSWDSYLIQIQKID